MRALATIRSREADLNHLMLATIFGRRPTDTSMSFWANSELLLPINLKVAIIKTLRRVCLPLDIDFARPNHLDAELLLAADKQMGRDVT